MAVGPDKHNCHEKEKGSLLKPWTPLGANICPICHRRCHSTKILNRHMDEVHLQTPVTHPYS